MVMNSHSYPCLVHWSTYDCNKLLLAFKKLSLDPGKGQRCHILASLVQGPAKQHNTLRSRAHTHFLRSGDYP